jgi:hypothetical protein
LDRLSASAMTDRLGGPALSRKADAVERGTVIGRLTAKVGAGLRSALMVDAGPVGRTWKIDGDGTFAPNGHPTAGCGRSKPL